MKYDLCENCGTGVANADESVWDGCTDRERAEIDERIEIMGLGTIESKEFDGYFGCWLCKQDSIWGGYEFTSEDHDAEDEPEDDDPYGDWVTVATDDDDTPIWSGPRPNAEEWLKSDQGQQFARGLAHRGVKLVIREWRNPA